jgi:hypothetical protein
MSKPNLQLIHCSNGNRPGAKRRESSSVFRPYVVSGGARSAPNEGSWEAALDLVDLCFLACYENYLAWLEASAAILGGPDRTDPEPAR